LIAIYKIPFIGYYYLIQNVLDYYITIQNVLGVLMHTTIRDVAQSLGLSITTVSRALDGYPDVSEATRQRVINAAQQMGYTPNRAARQLRRKRTDTLGYILPSGMTRFSEAFSSEFIAGLADEAAENSYDLLITSAVAGGSQEQDTYQRWVSTRRVDGFVINRVRITDWRIRFLAEQKVAFVSFERSTDQAKYPHVHVEAVESVANLVSYLVKQGRKRIAFIGGPEFLTIHSDRLQGYRKGLAQNYLPEDPTFVVLADLTSSGGYQAAKRLLLLSNSPDAIVCINDETAFGVLQAAREAQRSVGADLAVTGFDGIEDAIYTQPSLTTLNQPVYEISRQLVRMLLAEINGSPATENQVVIQPTLHIRDSTKK
jgi:LacI family transcriptional regulator